MGYCKSLSSLALLVISLSLILILINNINGAEASRLMKKVKLDDQSRRQLLKDGIGLTPQMG